MNQFFIINFFLATFISWTLLKLLIPFLSTRLLDIPKSRSSHSVPVPKGGGLIFVLILIPYSFLLANYFPLICIPLSIIGLLDDIIEIPSIIRFGTQIGTVFVITFQSPLLIILGMDNLFSIIILIFLAILGSAVINFINFMDGIDGIVAGTMSIIFFIIGIIIHPIGIICSGILLGFLYWNWHPSKIFMGDVGSTFLGCLLVAYLYNSGSLEVSFSLMLISSPLLADAFFTVIRRFIAKKNIFKAHKSHLYQRLHQNGYSHGIITSGYVGSVLCLGIVYFSLSIQYLIGLSSFILLLGFYIDNKFAKSFS